MEISQTRLMHGCGHVMVTAAMLLGAAAIWRPTREFAGTAADLPAWRRSYAGARAMMQDGLFDRFPCDEVCTDPQFAETEAGVIGITPGPRRRLPTALKSWSPAGGGARPHNRVDPVLVAAHIITAAQSIVSRLCLALDQAVRACAHQQAGNWCVVEADSGHVIMVGTVRTYRAGDPGSRGKRLTALYQSVAEGFGGERHRQVRTGLSSGQHRGRSNLLATWLPALFMRSVWCVTWPPTWRIFFRYSRPSRVVASGSARGP